MAEATPEIGDHLRTRGRIVHPTATVASVQTYVHSAQVRLEPGGDAGAPGAAVTVALCGHWEHDGPCRWPHHTAVRDPAGPELDLRVVFAADPIADG